MKINALIALICCILCGPQTTFAMHETQSADELSSLENIDKKTAFKAISKSTTSTKTPTHRHSPRTSSPLAHSTSAKDFSTLPTEQSSRISQSTSPIQALSHRYSPRTPSPLSHSTSASNLSDILDMSMVQSSIRSGGILIPMSVINNFSRPLTLQTTHTPLASDPNLLPLISEIEIQPGSHGIKGLFRLKKYGYGADEIDHALVSIKFIDPITDTVLKEITGRELRDSNMFFGVTLQPTSAKPPRPTKGIVKGFHVSPRQSRPSSPFALEPHQ